jgi:hypothetical protein
MHQAKQQVRTVALTAAETGIVALVVGVARLMSTFVRRAASVAKASLPCAEPTGHTRSPVMSTTSCTAASSAGGMMMSSTRCTVLLPQTSWSWPVGSDVTISVGSVVLLVSNTSMMVLSAGLAIRSSTLLEGAVDMKSWATALNDEDGCLPPMKDTNTICMLARRGVVRYLCLCVVVLLARRECC